MFSNGSFPADMLMIKYTSEFKPFKFNFEGVQVLLTEVTFQKKRGHTGENKLI